MAIDTANEQFALLSFGNTLMPQVLLSPGSLGQDDQQHLLWGYPGILWAAGAALEFVLDMNTRLRNYFADEYTKTPPIDLTTYFTRNLNGRTGDACNRVKAMIDDATA